MWLGDSCCELLSDLFRLFHKPTHRKAPDQAARPSHATAMQAMIAPGSQHPFRLAHACRYSDQPITTVVLGCEYYLPIARRFVARERREPLSE